MPMGAPPPYPPPGLTRLKTASSPAGAPGSSHDGQHEGDSVSAAPSSPRTLHKGDADAQALMAAINKLEAHIRNIHQSVPNFFERDTRKKYIMTLPTAQGWEVLNALEQAGAAHLAK